MSFILTYLARSVIKQMAFRRTSAPSVMPLSFFTSKLSKKDIISVASSVAFRLRVFSEHSARKSPFSSVRPKLPGFSLCRLVWSHPSDRYSLLSTKSMACLLLRTSSSSRCLRTLKRYMRIKFAATYPIWSWNVRISVKHVTVQSKRMKCPNNIAS